MGEPKFYDLCLIEVNEISGLVRLPFGVAGVGDLVETRDGNIAKVLNRVFLSERDAAYGFLLDVLPTFDVKQVFNVNTTWKEGNDAVRSS